MNAIAAKLGEVGLPKPVKELAKTHWDAVIVGGGHNGLTAAAYLAKAGQSVLVLERRERLGGACTLERPFPDARYSVSPCAYVVGSHRHQRASSASLALHPLVRTRSSC
jgi:phytoene dehydrogenase-like protein